MAEIKAIETIYNGYRFRSRLEARWAVFFDALGIRYEYEKEGFELDDGTRYLPDFYLPEVKTWVEIKGPFPSQDDWEKCERFATLVQKDARFRILIGEIPREPTIFQGIKGVKGYSYQWFCEECPEDWIGFFRHDNTLIGSRITPAMWVPYLEDRGIGRALIKARQARFEYGEKG